MRWSKEIRIAVVLLVLHTTAAKPGKSTAPAVFEVINEQARIDDKRILPYANPLAGNSQQNAKIHAQHQQAMFNAERVRQHRAQLQRWNKQPNRQQVDSYMKAYQESQENHHLALEQMQSNIKEKKSRSRPDRRQHAETLKDKPQIEPVKATRAESGDKNRNHRSYGSVYTTLYKKRKINTYPGPTYDQGVTIKPNGNVGLHNYEKEHIGLYTEAIPSKTQYIYPKLYSHMHPYQSANDIHTLNTLLSKPPQEQLTQLNSLIHNPDTGNDNLETPIDLYFYLKDPQLASVESPQLTYPSSYATKIVHPKDYTPITEDVDDIKDETDHRVLSYPPPTVPTLSTALSHNIDETTTTKSNYYKIEVEQTISGNVPKNIEYTSPEKSKLEALNYEKPLNFYRPGPSTEGVKYLQSQPTGVQHLSQDGTEVSAYGDDDVSKPNNRTKRQIDSNLFILGNETLTTQRPSIGNPIQSMSNDTLVNLEINCTLTIKNINGTLNSGNDTHNHIIDRSENLPTPEELIRNKYIQFDNSHQVGEAYDYDYTYYDDDPNSSSKFDYSYDNDYDPDYELSPPDYDYEIPKFRPHPNDRPNRPRRPHANKNFDDDGSFSNRYSSSFKHPKYYDYHPEPPNREYLPPSQQYGPPGYNYEPPLQYESNNQFGPPSNSYGQPIQQYGPPNRKPRPNVPQYTKPHTPDISNPISQVSSVIDSLEPVYVLSQSQIKELVGQQKLNIEHLDVFQVHHEPKPVRPRFPRQQKKKYRRRLPKQGRKNKFGKIRKLKKIVRF